MTEYTKRILAYCKEELRKAESERNVVLIAFYRARIEVMEEAEF